MMNIKSNPKVSSQKKSILSFWTKIVILFALGFIFLQKDVNFQVHLQSPLAQKQESKKEKPIIQTNTSNSIKKQVSLKGKNVQNSFSLNHVSSTQIQAYINRFSAVAQNEQQKFGIPASVILASGMLRSAAGQKNWAKKANNYFALPCDATWTGETQNFNGQCFRKYESAWAGFRGHSLFIQQHFSSLKKYRAENYKDWAKGLSKMQTNHQKQFARQVIEIIEKYQLNRLDKA